MSEGARLSAADLSSLDPYQRIHTGGVVRIFPKRTDGLCACGCGVKLPPQRRRWASNDCGRAAWIFYSIRSGNSQVIRSAVFKRDGGVCGGCGFTCDTRLQGPMPFLKQWSILRRKWEADHIIPIEKGGGACGLENFQTLCEYCHKTKTKEQAGQRAEERKSENYLARFRACSRYDTRPLRSPVRDAKLNHSHNQVQNESLQSDC